MATKKRAKAQGTSGGAAVAAGIGFQERVAAFAMAHALVGSDDLSSFAIGGGMKLSSVHLETAQVIDDVMLLGEHFRVLIQAKRSVSLSESLTSDFSSAIAQFVNHHLNERRVGDCYALATTLRSSDRVIFDLRKLTESVRLNAQALMSDPLTEAEKEVLRKTRLLISHHIATLRPGTVEDEEVDQIIRCIWILPLDIESGGRDEVAALALLKSRSLVEPRLIWSSLLELASTLALRRGSVDLVGLHERFGHLIKPAGEKKMVQDEFRLPVQQMSDVSAGKEVVVLDQFLGTEGLTVIEFYRFSEDGRRRLAFKGEICTLPDGSTQSVLYRAATLDGTARYFEANRAGIAGRKVTLVPYAGNDNPNDSPWAKVHQDLLNGILKRNSHLLQCIVCGDPVSENKALIAELDEDGTELAVGYVHQRCHRPSLRVLGEIRSDLFVDFSSLKDFDFGAWMLANRNGPSVISQSRVSDGVLYAAWKAVAVSTNRGNWCVRIDLEDGGASYAHERAKVVRLGQVEALQYAAELTSAFEKANAARNPWCYTSDKELYGAYASIASRLKVGQRLLKCIKAEAVPFSAAIDLTYSSKRDHYAPLVVLIELETGRPLDVLDTVPLISDPFDLSTYLDNWSAAGVQVPSYSVSVVANDRDFDLLVISCFERSKQVVIDPLFDMRGVPMRGLVVRQLEDLVGEK